MMNDLGSNQAALILNKRVLENLAISLDRKFFPGIRDAIAGQEQDVQNNVTCDGVPLETLLDNGVEASIETTANAMMPIPRLLYGTANAAFNPDGVGGGTAAKQLMNRLDGIHDAGMGIAPPLGPIRYKAGTFPCKVELKEDPSNYFTFIRDEFTPQAPPEIEVVSNAIEITIRGLALQADTFSRRRASDPAQATHNFVMKLRYRVHRTGTDDVNLGPVPFRMVDDPPAWVTVPLPAKGRLVFAGSPKKGVKAGWAINALPSSFTHEESQLTDALFYGSLDDEIYEVPEHPSPRYRVEPKSADEPFDFVLRDLCDPTRKTIARGLGGRIFLRFVDVSFLDLTPRPAGSQVSGAKRDRLMTRIVKINPLLAQTFTCASGLPGTALDFNQLELLGPHGLDIPLLPQRILFPVCPRWVEQGDDDPGQPGSVAAGVTERTLDHPTYLPSSQSFGLSDAAALVTDFSQGADLAVGFGDEFLAPQFEKMAEDVKNSILESGDIPGLAAPSLRVSVAVRPGRIALSASGEGTYRTPRLLPNIRYSFSMTAPVRVCAVPDVVKDSQGQALDRFACPIPNAVLRRFGLDPKGRPGDVFLPESGAAVNPLSFRTYWDPGNGAADFASLSPPRFPPLLYDASGLVVPVDPDNPPSHLYEGDHAENLRDRPEHQSQRAVAEVAGVKTQYILETRMPSKDELEVNVDVKWSSLIAFWLASVFIVFAGGVAGGLSVGFVLGGFLTFGNAVTFIPFITHLPSRFARKKLAESIGSHDVSPSFSPEVSLSSGLVPYLESPGSEPEPVDLQEDAFITRNHLVVRAAGLNEAFPDQDNGPIC